MADKPSKFYLRALLACGKRSGNTVTITSETIRETNIKLEILKMVAEMQAIKGKDV